MGYVLINVGSSDAPQRTYDADCRHADRRMDSPDGFAGTLDRIDRRAVRPDRVTVCAVESPS